MPHAVVWAAGSSWDVSEQRHLCPFVQLHFLSEELEAALSWDLFQTKINLFLSNKAV